jgi:phycobilisome core component
MRDAVTSLIKNYDVTGRYFDRDAIDDLKAYFRTGNIRVQVVGVINADAAAIVRQAGMALFDENPELIRPGGYAYTTITCATPPTRSSRGIAMSSMSGCWKVCAKSTTR